MSDDLSVNKKTAQGMARSNAYHADESGNYGIVHENTVYCSDACLPPLAAQPAEAVKQWCCGYAAATDGADHISACPNKSKPAEQPKPAAKGHDFSDPYCARRYEGAVVRLCVACGAFDIEGMRAPACEAKNWRPGYEGWLGGHEHGILRDPAIPERIVKPQMAHSMGIEDPAPEDA
jgi:hypothetical protein